MNRQSASLNPTNSGECKISRRDWFRWGRRTASSPAQQADGTANSAELRQLIALTQPIAQPTNYGELHPNQLPPLSAAELEAEHLEQLFDDLRQFARRTSVQCRGQAPIMDQRPLDGAAQLLAVRAELSSGRLSRVQIRYEWDGAWWIDTLESRNGRFRLVRISHEITNLASPPQPRAGK